MPGAMQAGLRFHSLNPSCSAYPISKEIWCHVAASSCGTVVNDQHAKELLVVSFLSQTAHGQSKHEAGDGHDFALPGPASP